MSTHIARALGIALAILCQVNTFSAVIGTSGTVVYETSPYPAQSNNEIFVFDEQQGVAFTTLQSLDFGAIAQGTLVNSHYIQFDPITPSGVIGSGTITFDGPILGVIVSTDFLNQDLGSLGTSDFYFGLEGQLGPYPTGLDPDARGLGSPEDDLIIGLGGNTLVINSLQIPGGTAAGNLDGFRVLTAATPVPIPSTLVLFSTALLTGWRFFRHQTA